MGDKIYRVLLVLYPPGFRRRNRRDMLAAFRRLRASDGRGPVRFWVWLLGDCALSAARAWGDQGVRICNRILKIRRNRPMLNWLFDLRIALRSFVRRPRFAVTAIGTLALGIGASTAIFSVVDAVLLRPLPFPDEGRLVMIWETERHEGRWAVNPSPGNFLDWESQAASFQCMGAWGMNNPMKLGSGDRLELAEAALVTEGFFETAGIRPLLGRTFAPDEVKGSVYGAAGAHLQGQQVVVLSEAFWRSRFGGDEAIVGSEIEIGEKPFTVLGVMPAQLSLPGERPDIYLPWDLYDSYTYLDDGLTRNRGGWRIANPEVPRDFRWLSVVGRLKADVDIEQARKEMSVIAEGLAQAHPQTNKGWGADVVPLREMIVGDSSATLLMLWGAVTLLLLIACCNVAALLMARAWSQGRELAVRSALGASSWRLLRQMAGESLLLAAGGGAAGLLLAVGLLPLLLSLTPAEIPRLDAVQTDWRVLLFTCAISLVTGLLAGLAPAFQAVRSDPAAGMRQGGRSAAPAAGRQWLRRSMVSAEIALALMLLVGAGLLVRSLLRVVSVDPGFDIENVVDFRMNLEAEKYGRNSDDFYNRLVEEIKQLPGVVSAAAVTRSPMTGDTEFLRPYRDPEKPNPQGEAPRAAVRIATPGYFEAMGIPILAGRDFTPQDRHDSPPVIVIDEDLAQLVWPGQDPLGRRLIVDWIGERDYQVVGIVPRARYLGLRTPSVPQLIFAHAQIPYLPMHVVVRAASDPSALFEPLRQAARRIDPSQPTYRMSTLEEQLRGLLAADRFAAVLLSALAVLALLLAGVGTYASLHFLVGLRRHEIGVRMALGARRRSVVGMILGETLALAGAGAVVGLIGALALTRLIQGLLFEVSPLDPTALGAALALLMVAALAAGSRPARQAAKADPLRTLRCE